MTRRLLPLALVMFTFDLAEDGLAELRLGDPRFDNWGREPAL